MTTISGTTATDLQLLQGDQSPRELAQRLDVLEKELRHSWASLLGVSSVEAGRVGAAGRLVQRARLLLNDPTAIV